MASRKSTRLRRQDTPRVQSSPALSSNDKDLEARVSKQKTAPKTTARKAAASKGNCKREQAPTGPRSTSSEDALSSLTPELLYMVLDNIKDSSTIGKLARTSKLYYSIMMPLLHKRVAAAAAYHAHIPKLIRTLEPHLTITQKKQLKTEGKYKGQQARYVEEALKNMVNLEMLDLSVLTIAMSESIASLKNLQALRLIPKESEFKNETLEPLLKIKNLKHLSLHNLSYYCLDEVNFLRSMLLNSSTTLQSLSISNAHGTSFMAGFPDLVVKDRVLSQREYAFRALKSLELYGMPSRAQLVYPLQKAIDFMALRDLTVEGQELDRFIQTLAGLARLASDKGAKISLRSLTLDMYLTDHRAMTGQIRRMISAASSFLSAFDSLKSLEVKDFQCHKNAAIDPLSTVSLLQAITKHKGLRTLKFSCTGTSDNYRVAFFRASSVTAIVDNCQHLREFEFAPHESEIVSIFPSLVTIFSNRTRTDFCRLHAVQDAIGQAISQSDSLISLKHSSFTYPRPENSDLKILSSIIKPYLSRDLVQDSESFLWESHFKLRNISIGRLVWEISSKFGKGTKGMKKAEKMQSRDGKREVMYRDVSGVAFQGEAYAPSSKWLDRVESYKS
ncbi:hypothetical protein EG327_010662 [Venturia inaequalis]|uniref:Uncharacterized protein n=1 Tax=Venturia inaequalis TaxID=5025 RepID=A0A8H3YRK6_VENIN|nr:hypothetical protein EG327_010662 [Venturia inaequalis]